MVRDLIADRGTLDILDLGTGTGALAIDAARRWPAASIIGIDIARGMLSVARQNAATAIASASERPRWLRGDAERLPVADESVDLVVSSFVLQLVPDRQQALAEIVRVLRPGGRFAFVTWLVGRDHFTPDVEFDEAVYDLDIDEDHPEEDPRSGDFRSITSAERELRRAGLIRVKAEFDQLDQAWTAQSYLDYKVEYDEISLFEDLDDSTGRRLRERARERLAKLVADAFRWQPQIVQAHAHKRVREG